jgi:uncharacterized BrkB/YihY/UPF0761 family membrane protein
MSAPHHVTRRSLWALFLAGPVIWATHFLVVYFVGEAWCTKDGPTREVLGLHVLSFLTVVATVLGVGAALLIAAVAHARWRARTDDPSDWMDGDDLNPGLALAGALLGVLFAVAILFVGLPAAFVGPC